MLQLNDSGNTLIDLTTNNLRGISYSGSYDLTVKLKIKDVVLETEFEYDSIAEAKADYKRLIAMIDSTPSLLTEQNARGLLEEMKWID
jgi:hypothetical protein